MKHELKGRTVLVAGMGKSGLAAVELLRSQGAIVRTADERPMDGEIFSPLLYSLAPGESVTVNEAVTDVPRSARFAEIGWKPD